MRNNQHYDSTAIVNFRITRTELLSVSLNKQNLVTARRSRVKQETNFSIRRCFSKKSVF